MAPPPSSLAPAIHPVVREVTEDTPPDLLEGTMDLLVILPTKKTLRMTVNRRTPMMDLLIQVTTANKINPGGHVVQIRNERGTELQYKPSTPIGALDTTTIEIVPKNQVNEYIIVKQQAAKITTQPFEHTFRLQVHLPRNQLHVMRVGPKTQLQDILEDVCQAKNLDIAKYEIRHPINLDEKLPLNSRLGDFGLQQLTVVSRNSRINSSVSTADIMALQQNEDGRNKLDSAFKYSRSSVGDSSVSSESAASARGPYGSDDDSRSVSPLPPITQPKLKSTASNASSSTLLKSSTTNLTKAPSDSNMDLSRPKKRAAPPPPQSPATEQPPTPISQATNVHRPLSQSLSQPPPGVRPAPRKKDPPRDPPVKVPDSNHSRHSSDSSGYHEASTSILSESQDIRGDRPMSSSTKRIGSLNSLSNQGMNPGSSTTNLTSVSSLSSTSLASSNGGSRNKRKAPKPPVLSLQAQNELDEETGAGIEPETPISPSGSPQGRTEVDVTVEVHTRKEADNESNEGTLKPGTASPSSRTSSTFSSPTLTKSGTSSSSSSQSGSSSSSSPSNSKASMTPLSSKLLSNPSNHPTTAAAPSSTTLDASSSSPQLPRPASSPTTQANPSSSAPMPQPRTKPRDLPVNPQPPTPALPQPRAKPRPDRKTVTEAPPAPALTSPTETAPVSVPLRKPMSSSSSRIGVKVFPDNALEDRTTARLSASHLRDTRSTHDNPNPKVRPSTPNDRTSTTHLLETRSSTPPLHGNPKPLPSNHQAQTPAPIFPSTTGSLRSLQGLKNSPSSVIQTQTRPPGPDSVSDSDSDHLDEHLELFEARKRRSHKARAPIPAAYKPPNATTTTLPRAASDSNILNEVREEDEPDDVVSAIVKLDEPKKRLSSYPRTRQVHKPQADIRNLPLNRWGNTESLQEAEYEAVSKRLSTTSPSSTNMATTNKSRINTGSQPLNPKLPVPATKTETRLTSDTSDEDGSGQTSQEDSSSEASYADSGLPATTTVTPSPISLDHEDVHGSDHGSVKSVHSSSRRSSLQSDQSESWRELLQSKVDGQQNTEPSVEPVEPFKDKPSRPSPDPSPETKIKVNPSSNFQASPSPSAHLDKLNDGTPEPELDFLYSASDEERKEKLKISKEVKDTVAQPRKLPKAESFSHHSEFDVVKMKRKTFAGSGPSRQQQQSKKSGSASASSSDEDEQRFSSMQNLSNNGKAEASGSLESSGKARSVLGLQELGPDIRDNPQLMQTFQVELETQFEQWKEDFLQRHLGNSVKTGSVDSSSAQDVSQQENKAKTNAAPVPVPVEPKASNLSSHSSSSISLKVSDDEVEEFDPAQPQIVHSVGARTTVTELRRQSSTEESEIKTNSVTPDKSEAKASKLNSSGTESEDTVNEDEAEMNDVQIVPQRRVKPATNSDTPVYRYSGPPSIQMGTWGERPHRTISVKKDKDYIMGMGQQDGKLEIKSSTSNSTVGNRVHSFNGGSPSPTPTTSAPRTLTPSRWSSVSVNSDSEPNQSVSGGTLPSVVSSWKQRLEESEKARKNQDTVLQPKLTSADSEPKKVDIEIKSMSATSTLERPRVSKPSFSISSASSTLERPVKRSPSPAMFSISPAAPAAPVQLKPEPKKFQPAEPKQVTIDTVDSARPAPVTVSHTKIQATQSFSMPNTNNGSMEDKKRFFQGVKPVESPTKEVPLPAVNLKSSIATIQKVFEERQVQKSSSSASMSGSERSFGSRESSASPALSNSSYSSSGSTSAPKKTEFIGAQSSSNVMMQKLIGRGTAFNLDALRRTPSPSVGSSYNDSERSTPSPIINDSHIQISTGHNIKNVGNKAIITVGGDSGNNNQFKQQLRVNGEAHHQNQPVKVNVNGKANDSMVIVNSSENHKNAPNSYASIKETFSKNKPIIVQETVKEPIAKRNSGNTAAVIVQETAKDPIAKRNSVSIPPPPPPMQQHVVQRPTSLGKLSRSSTGSNSLNSNSALTPTSPLAPGGEDPRAAINDAIKNSNGNFGLKKTNSTMLLR